MFFWISGDVAMDFANTVVTPDRQGDGLAAWEDLRAFVDEAAARFPGLDLCMPARRGPEGTPLGEARRLRAAIREALAALCAGNPVPATRIRPINRWLRQSPTWPELVYRDHGWALLERGWPRGSRHPLAAIARAAARLIADGTGIRRCEGAACVLLFRDRSRNGRRRWCSMATCGNRAKAAAWQRRRRQTATGLGETARSPRRRQLAAAPGETPPVRAMRRRRAVPREPGRQHGAADGHERARALRGAIEWNRAPWRSPA